MNSFELRKRFLDFFEKRRHKIVSSSSLIPEDKTVLLTSAGMQQFIPYLSGQKDVVSEFGSRRLASAQKCFRTLDIEEVGDDTHHTFFEMLGNWSIGEDEEGYFKEGAIELALDFLVGELGLDKKKIWVTVFSGEGDIPKDKEATEIWKKKGIPGERILEFGSEDNFWGPVAETGPCGPCSEIHYDRGQEFGCKDCGPNCEKCNRYVELWNLVFMEYDKKEDGSFEKLPQRNVDTGIGFERLVALLQGKGSAYETDLFDSIIKKLEKVSGIEYAGARQRFFRIISDHTRGAVFLISDGILPSNMERGYILRRIIRRAILHGKILKVPDNFLITLAKETIGKYNFHYSYLRSKQEEILTVIQKEEEKFEKTLERGLKELEKIIDYQSDAFGAKDVGPKGEIDAVNPEEVVKTLADKLFFVYQTYGFPIELSLEVIEDRLGDHLAFKDSVVKDFWEKYKEHQKISRAGAEKKFGGVGKEVGYKQTRLHTATHLLHQALREVLGDKVKQMGSDINSKRLRFDFFYDSKMTDEQIKKVEDIVNQKIKEDIEVKKQEMPLKEALGSGALAFFKEKYPAKVTVFSVGGFSKEICAGPHVGRTSELGKFEILKEKSSGAGVRRIKAALKDI